MTVAQRKFDAGDGYRGVSVVDYFGHRVADIEQEFVHTACYHMERELDGEVSTERVAERIEDFQLLGVVGP